MLSNPSNLSAILDRYKRTADKATQGQLLRQILEEIVNRQSNSLPGHSTADSLDAKITKLYRGNYITDVVKQHLLMTKVVGNKASHPSEQPSNEDLQDQRISFTKFLAHSKVAENVTTSTELHEIKTIFEGASYQAQHSEALKRSKAEKEILSLLTGLPDMEVLEYRNWDRRTEFLYCKSKLEHDFVVFSALIREGVNLDNSLADLSEKVGVDTDRVVIFVHTKAKSDAIQETLPRVSGMARYKCKIALVGEALYENFRKLNDQNDVYVTSVDHVVHQSLKAIDGKLISTKSIYESIITGDLDDSLFIFGEGGIGKTEHCKHFYKRMKEYGSSSDAVKKRIPIYLDADTVKMFLQEAPLTDMSPIELLFNAYWYTLTQSSDTDTSQKAQIHAKLLFEKNVQYGNVILILDSLDEIQAALPEAKIVETLVRQLDEFAKTFAKTRAVITSRLDYSNFFAQSETFKTLQLQAFTSENVDEYTKARCANLQKQITSKAIIRKINNIGTGNKADYKFISPLICDLVVTAVNASLIDERNSHSYDVSDLFDNVAKRELVVKELSSLAFDDFVYVLTHIATRNSQTISELDFEDLLDAILDPNVIAQAKQYFQLSIFLKHDPIKDNYSIKHGIYSGWLRRKMLAIAFSSSNRLNEYRGLVDDIFRYVSREESLNFYTEFIAKTLAVPELWSLFEGYLSDARAKSAGDIQALDPSDRLLTTAGATRIFLEFHKSTTTDERTALLARLSSSSRHIKDFPIIRIDQTLSVDGYIFENCRFENSKCFSGKEISATTLVFDDCVFNNSPIINPLDGVNIRKCRGDQLLSSALVKAKKSDAEFADSIKDDLRQLFKVFKAAGGLKRQTKVLFRAKVKMLHSFQSLEAALDYLTESGWIEKSLNYDRKDYGYEVSQERKYVVSKFLDQAILDPSLRELVHDVKRDS